MMVASISSEQSQTRPTLLPSSSSSDKPSSNGVSVSPSSKKPRGRQVSSRYMSPSPSPAPPTSSSRRFPSPLLSRSTNSPLPTKRAVSADRRRPASGNGSNNEVSAAAKLLVKSTRSLSVSFQGESYSLPVSKTKAPSPSSPGTARKPTPERRRATPPRSSENSKPSAENHNRWPARARLSLTQSVDFGAAGRLAPFGSTSVAASSRSIMEDPRRVSFDGRLSLDLGTAERSIDISDTDSVSSGSTTGGGGGVSSSSASRVRAGTPRGLVVSAKFWQETNSRLRRLQDPGSPNSTSPVAGARTPGKYSPRTNAMGSSPRPASPGKLWSSSATPVRGSVSPCRARSVTPSILSFAVDVVRRGKMGEDRIVEAHMLRLLYNRYLQWRFANARADSASMLHKLNAERNLWNAWVTISELRHSVTLKRIKLLLLRQKLKLTSIIKAQITHLEDWGVIDRDHSNSLLGATEALKASTLRLPVGGKTVVCLDSAADIQKLKDAVGSAVDVMQAMGTSICALTLKAEDMNTLVAELLKVTVKERVLLEQSKDFLSKLAAMQVKDCSLRTHIIQFNHVPTTGSLTTRV